jgi:DNA-binding GntR family transcriptional regulator
MVRTVRKMGKIDFEGAGLVHQISQTLIQAILNRTLRGGDQLVETALQKMLGVSRSPLREAFRELEKKGLVVIRPRRGTFVRQITRKDIDEHYPVLAALEGLAARQAHSLMGPAQYRALGEAIKAMEKAVRESDVKAYEERHEFFHEIYIEACQNNLLIEMIMNLRLRGNRLRYFFPHTSTFCQERLETHRRIMHYLCDAQADPELVDRTVREHISQMLTMEGWEL